MNRKETLEQATACVMKDRQATHGKPEDSFGTIGRLWSAYLGIDLASHQVAAMMVLLKVARSKTNPQNEDNWVDIAGYAACGAELAPQPDDHSKVESFWKKTPPSVGDDVIRGLDALIAKQKNNPCTGESPSPLPATVLESRPADFITTIPAPGCAPLE